MCVLPNCGEPNNSKYLLIPEPAALKYESKVAIPAEFLPGESTLFSER